VVVVEVVVEVVVSAGVVGPTDVLTLDGVVEGSVVIKGAGVG
jgi:hypothetical protein